MTCSTCAPFGALTGRVVTGRNTPNENIRYPLTDQRAEQYGTTPVPLGIPANQRLDATNFLQGLTVGFIIGIFLLTATGRSIGRAAGKRVERRLRP